MAKFPEGRAIVAFCEEESGAPRCNKGVLGSDNGNSGRAEYKGMTVEYSGYNGVDSNSGRPSDSNM